MAEKEIRECISDITDSLPAKIVLSDRKKRREIPGLPDACQETIADDIIKVTINRKKASRDKTYQAEKFTKTQVFHTNLTQDELPSFLAECLLSGFSVINAYADDSEFNVRITKKNKALYSRKQKEAQQNKSLSPINDTFDIKDSCCCSQSCSYDDHNRKKNYLIPEGTIVPPLIDMGVLTKEGKVVRSMQDKFRQINRFLEFVDDEVNKYGRDELTVIDFGCGKSYLTFILYYYFTFIRGIKVKMIGLDLKADVIKNCNLTAKKYGYDGLEFFVGDINGFDYHDRIDMIVTLHACDTATDFALYNAIKWNTKMIFSVPCCQHEVNSQIDSEYFKILTKYGLIKERISALFTDAIRGSLLEACGYKTNMLEFIDITHTPKNILIRAVKTNVSKEKRERSLKEVERLTEEFGLDQTLFRLLKEDNII